MPSIKRNQVAGMNWHYKRHSLEYCLDAFQRIGYQSIAFWAGPPHFQIDDCGYGDIRSLKKQFQSHGLNCISFTACAGHQAYQFGIYGKEHVEQAYRYFCNGVHAASELEVPLMTANSGHGFITEPHSDVRKRSAELLWRVAEEGRRCGVTLTVESLRPQETTVGVTLADVKQLLDEVNHPNCKAMIDTTAMGVSGESIWDWFREFDGEIHNLHFVDGAPMGHLAWGDGVFHLQDMLQCLNAYDYAGPIGLEITHSRYFSRPEVADAQTFCVLQRYMED